MELKEKKILSGFFIRYKFKGQLNKLEESHLGKLHTSCKYRPNIAEEAGS